MAGQYGSYKYESQESRALKSITADSYNKDQAKNLIQLNQNSEYMAQYLRKLQKGVDEANQNIIESAQGFISDLIVLLGGGGATGLDFGDLKYVFQAIGALFGFTNSEGNIQLPVNVFNAAWHFFSTYIVPVGNFGAVINALIDNAIAGLIDFTGDIPIVGEAIQQLAVIITDIRDALAPIGETVSKILDAFGGSIEWVIGWFADLIGGLFDIFGPILGPANHVLSQILSIISGWTVPLVDAIEHIVEVATNMIRSLTGGLNYSDFTDSHFNILTVIPEIIGNFIRNGLLGIGSALNAANLFGVLKAFHIPQLPFSHIGNSNVNLLVEPGFTSEDSIQLGEGWIRDTTQGHEKPGAAKATAGTNGIDRIIQSISIPASWEQTIRTSVWVRWQGLIYTGTNPITMDLIRIKDGAEISRTTLASITSPAVNQPAWMQLLGTDYIIPNDGTDEIRLQLRLRGTATAGSIWFDDADLRKVSNGLPQNWILNLVPDLGGLRQFIQDVIDGIIGAIRGIPFIGGGIADLIEWITGWQEDTDTAAAQAADAYIGLNVTQQIVIASTTGSELELPVGQTMTAQDELVQQALESQTASIISANAQVEQIQSAISGSETSGVRVLDAVEDVYENELDPSVWEEYTLEGAPGDGWLETKDGQNISMGALPGAISTKMYKWIGEGEETLTNYQKITASVSRSLIYPGFGDFRRPNYAVYCRVSDDGTKWVRAYFDTSRRLVVDYRNGSSYGTLFNSGSDWAEPPGAGSSFSIEPGVGVDERLFRIWRGNQPLIIVEDPSSATDTTQKGHGIGMRMDANYATATYNQYTAVDNKQVDIPGYGFRVYRSTTNGIRKGANAKLDFFDIEAEDTDDAWDSVNQKYVIPESGWWIFKVRVGGANSQTGSPPAALALYIDGSVVEYGNQGLRNNSWTNTPADSLTGTFGPYPLKKGQVIEAYMAYVNGINYNCIGDAGGAKTSFSGSLTSRNR